MLGKMKPHYVRGRLVKKTMGNAVSVKFDWNWVLKREEKKGDVLGFWHTHPNKDAEPSERDIKTMKAWTNCLGKCLFCVIQNSYTKRAYSFLPSGFWHSQPLAYKIFRHFGVFI